MKSKMKRQGTAELPRFIVGALATAGASAASGATVQISFANNVVSSSTGTTNFVPDLTGDNLADVDGSAGPSWAFAYKHLSVLLLGRAQSTSSIRVRARVGYDMQSGQWVAGVNDVTGSSSAVLRALVPFKFSDSRINGGLETNGWLDVEARANLGSDYRVQIQRLIFDASSTIAPTGVSYTDADYSPFVSAVPEPGSNLALLALGAGGLTLRRRLKRAA